MKTKALNFPVSLAATTLLVGACLYMLINQANAGGTDGASPAIQIVQDKGRLSEAELMLLIHRPELPRAAGPGAA